MASPEELLSGQSDHTTFAPLSHAATVQLCQHLQHQINHLQTDVHYLQHHSKVVDETVRTTRAGLSNTNERIVNLQDELVKTNQGMGHLQKDFERSEKQQKQLSKRQDAMTEKLKQVAEQHGLLRAEYTELKSGIERTSNSVEALKQQVEEDMVDGEIAALKANIMSATVNVKQLQEGHAAFRVQQEQQRDVLQKTGQTLQETSTDLQRTNSAVAVLKQRQGETQRSLKSAIQSLDECNLVVTKVKGDHEVTKESVKENTSNLKSTSTLVGEMHNNLKGTMNNLEATKKQLDDTVKKLLKTKAGLDETSISVKSLRENQDRVAATTNSIKASLSDTQGSLYSLERDYHETSSLVLPNLTMDDVCNLPQSSAANMAGGIPAKSARAVHGGHNSKSPTQGVHSGRDPRQRSKSNSNRAW